MSRTQLAQRMGIRRQSLADLEASEANGQITLDRLQKAARPLDSHVVYALVPNGESFDEIVQKRAEQVARSIVRQTANTMALETQDIDAEEQRARVAELKDELLRSPRTLWNDGE